MSKKVNISASIDEDVRDMVIKCKIENVGDNFSLKINTLLSEALTARRNAKYKEDKLTLTDALINQKE